MGWWSRSHADGVVVVSQSAFASSASKNRSTQRPSPQQCSQVVGQAPNFSPSSPIIPTRSRSSVANERRYSMTSGTSRNGMRRRSPCSVPNTPRSRPWSSVVYGPHRSVFRDGRRAEVRVVEDGPAIAAGDEGRRQVRLPDALGEPGAGRPSAEEALEFVAHASKLPDPVALGQRGEDRFVVAAAQDLDLLAGDEGMQSFDEVGPLGGEPGQQRAGVVERQPYPVMTLQRLEHREIGLVIDLGEDPAEVPDRLVVVEREGQRDAGRHRAQRRLGGDRGASRGVADGDARGGEIELLGVFVEHPVVEKRHRVVAIERRITSSQPGGSPVASRV